MSGDISVGLTLSIAVGAPATYDSAGFNALTYTVIVDAESVPTFGGTAQVPEFIPLATGIVDKGKGSINYGDTTIPLRRIITDAGQLALQSAFDGANKGVTHSIRMVHPTGGTIFFTAIVSGFTFNFGDANAFARNEVTFSLKNKPLPVTTVFVVNFVAGANGSIVGVTPQLVATGGSTSAVYAAGATGFEFDEWSDSNTDNPRTLSNVTQNTTLTASFVPE
jgi:hypothetical protein